MKIFLLIMTVVIGGLYIIADSPIEKLFILLMFLTLVLPMLLSVLSFIIRNAIKSIDKNEKKNPFSKKVDKNGNIMLKSELHNTYNQKTALAASHRIFNSKNASSNIPEYDQVRNLIVSCSKNRQLSRSIILDLKAMLRSILGVNYEPYTHMNFKNDLHEIYVLLKSHHLSKEDYSNLYTFIDKATQQRD